MVVEELDSDQFDAREFEISIAVPLDDEQLADKKFREIVATSFEGIEQTMLEEYNVSVDLSPIAENLDDVARELDFSTTDQSIYTFTWNQDSDSRQWFRLWGLASVAHGSGGVAVTLRADNPDDPLRPLERTYELKGSLRFE